MKLACQPPGTYLIRFWRWLFPMDGLGGWLIGGVREDWERID